MGPGPAGTLSPDDLAVVTLELEAHEQAPWSEPSGDPTTALDPAWSARVLHVSRSAVMITDAELDRPGPRILYVNPAFEQLSGYRAQEVLGRDPRFLQGRATDPTVLRRLRRDLASTGAFEGQAINYRKDGTPFVMSWRISTVRDAEGRPRAYVAVQEDGTSAWLEELRSAEAILAIQRSSLPAELPDLGDVHVAVAYRPADRRRLIGGDWYDVVRAEQDHLVVGDVSGHGVAAAAEMGRLRLALHALLTSGRTPAGAVADLRRTLGPSSESFASLAIATLDTTRRHLSVLTCGHPPVLLVRRHGGVEQVSSGHRMIGVEEDPAARAATVPLDHGDVVVLATDGLLESRGTTVLDGVSALAGHLAATPPGRDLDVALEQVITTMVGERGTTDDLTVLLARAGTTG